MTFWTFVPPADDAPPAPERLGAMLADLHAALRGCDLGLPVLAPLLEDIPRFLDRAARTGTLPAGDVAALRAAFERLTAEVSLDPGQPLHATLTRATSSRARCGVTSRTPAAGPWPGMSPRWPGRRASTAPQRSGPTRASGTAVDQDALAPWLALRELHLTVWVCLYAERGPRLRPQAEELLPGWRRRA